MPNEKWPEVDTMTSVVFNEESPREGGPDACIVHVSESNALTRTKLLDRNEITVGRASECSLVIPVSHVSRIHLKILREDKGWTVRDNKSANGILVNGVKKESSLLTFGDRIDLGRGEILLYRPYDSDYQRALEAQKLESLGRLASGIAHDFNNVLMAIVGAATCLQEDIKPGPDDGVEQTIADIMAASDRGADLAGQLLSFSRKGEDANDIVDITDIVKEVTRLVERTFDQSIRVTMHADTDATVIANGSQLSQLLMNLCINARDAMPHGGELAVSVVNADPRRTQRLGSFVCVSVRDTGIGMSDEVRDRVFEPFFSTKGEGRGTGLGMSTSYGIVKKYSGEIEIDSEEGVGTTISVYLPAEQRQVSTAPPTPANFETQSLRPQGEGRYILLAEDQKLVRKHTGRILRKLGFVVVEARDGVEAVEAVKAAETPFVLAMLDLQMPRRSGDEACRMIRVLEPDLPVVMVSGNVEDPRIEALVQSDGVAVLAKPFRAIELAQVLMGARKLG